MFKRTLFRGANASRVEVPTKCTVKENAQALVAPGRFVVEGSFRRSENASRGQGFLAARLAPVLAPFNCLAKCFSPLFAYLDAVLFENVHAFLAFRVAYLQHAED